MSESVIWNELGNIYCKIGSSSESISAYLMAIELAPQFGPAYSNLATAYCADGKFSEAIPLYQKSIELLATDEEKSFVWNKLGDAYWRIRNFENAISAYDSAMELCGEINVPKYDAIPSEQSLSVEEEVEELATDDTDGEETEMFLSATESNEPLGSVDQVVEAGLHLEKITYKEFDGELDLTELETGESDPPLPGLISETVSPRKNVSSWYLQPPTVPETPREPATSGQKISWAFGPQDLTGNSTGIAAVTNRLLNASGSRLIQPSIQASLQEVGQQLLEKENESDEGQVDLLFALFGNRLTEQEAASRTDTQQKVNPPAPVAEPARQIPNGQVFKSDVVEAPRRKGDTQTSIETYKKIVEAAPLNDKAWFTLGKLYKDSGNTEDAIAAFEQATLLCPANRDYHYHLGLVYAAQKCHQEAINRFLKVIQIDPEFIVAHCALGGSYRRLGMGVEAIKHLKIAAPGMQNESEYNRACFEAIYGNNEKAVGLLKVAIQSKQVSIDWLRSDPDLDFIREDEGFKSLLRGEL
jgi:tetratricopeptide (TPR) repeat protein